MPPPQPKVEPAPLTSGVIQTQPIAAIPQLAELNIGHYLVGEAVFVGLEQAVRQMRELMDAAR